MKDVPPSQKRVPAIVEMMEECGLYTHAREVAKLGEQRDRCEAALRQIVGLLNAAKIHPAVRHITLAVTNISNEALKAGVDEEFEYIQKIADELRAQGKMSREDIEARLRQDDKL